MSIHTAIDRTATIFEHLYFIPAGTSVDSVTVAKATWPDTVPTTNYTDYKIKECRNIAAFETKDSDPLSYIAETTGVWTEEDRTKTKTRGITFETYRYNALVKMLEHGLAALPVAGTPAVPGARSADYVDGVLLREIGEGELGVITERQQVWARLQLVNPGARAGKTAVIQLRLTFLDSGNNTYELVDLEA